MITTSPRKSCGRWLPQFSNEKYQQDYRVEARELATATYQTADFKVGEVRRQTLQSEKARSHSIRQGVTAKRTPSDHDWRWAQDRLRSGECIAVPIQRLEDYRYDKPRPQYYARCTVTRAYVKVALSEGADPEDVIRTIGVHPPRVGMNGEQYARATVEEFRMKLGRTNKQGLAQTTQASVQHERQHRHAHQLDFGGMPS